MRVEAVIDEVERAVPAIIGLVGQADVDRNFLVEALAPRLEERAFRSLEGEIDRIDRVDRGQQSGRLPASGRDQIARVDPAVGNPSRYRRAHSGELHIELARAHLRAGSGKLCLVHAYFGLQAVDLVGRDRVFRDQALGPGQVAAGERQRARCAGGARLRFGQAGAERPGVDGEQRRACADELAVGEVDRGHLAGNARTHFDRAAGFETTDEVVPLGHFALDRLGDRHFGRRRRGSRSHVGAQEPPGGEQGSGHRDHEDDAPVAASASVARLALFVPCHFHGLHARRISIDEVPVVWRIAPALVFGTIERCIEHDYPSPGQGAFLRVPKRAPGGIFRTRPEWRGPRSGPALAGSISYRPGQTSVPLSM